MCPLPPLIEPDKKVQHRQSQDSRRHHGPNNGNPAHLIGCAEGIEVHMDIRGVAIKCWIFILLFKCVMKLIFEVCYRGQHTKRNFTYAKLFCLQQPIGCGQLGSFTFHYFQHGIFAQV